MKSTKKGYLAKDTPDIWWFIKLAITFYTVWYWIMKLSDWCWERAI